MHGSGNHNHTQAVEADENLATTAAALEDATTALRDYIGENGAA